MRSVDGVVVMDQTGISVSAGMQFTTVAGTNASLVAGAKVDITAGGGISITAPAVQVNAPVVTFAGVVVAQTLIADAVIGGFYTSAPGNLV